jgi:hypothetical protein
MEIVQNSISDVLHFVPVSQNYMVQLNKRHGSSVFLSFWKLEKLGIKLAKIELNLRTQAVCFWNIV